jgi:hypothetical protein
MPKYQTIAIDMTSTPPQKFHSKTHDDRTYAVLDAEYQVDCKNDRNRKTLAIVYDLETDQVIYTETATRIEWGDAA